MLTLVVSLSFPACSSTVQIFSAAQSQTLHQYRFLSQADCQWRDCIAICHNFLFYGTEIIRKMCGCTQTSKRHRPFQKDRPGWTTIAYVVIFISADLHYRESLTPNEDSRHRSGACELC